MPGGAKPVNEDRLGLVRFGTTLNPIPMWATPQEPTPWACLASQGPARPSLAWHQASGRFWRIRRGTQGSNILILQTPQSSNVARGCAAQNSSVVDSR